MTLPKITPSSVSSLECARRFKTLYIDRNWPPRDNSPHTATEFGTAYHEVKRHVFDPRHPPLPNLKGLDIWTRAAFLARRYSDPAFREKEMARCQRMVKGYAASDEDAEATIDVERQGEFLIQWRGEPLFVLAAKFDRVIVRPHDPTRLVIRDYKTTARRVSLEEAFIMLWAAKLAYPTYDAYDLELDWIDGDDGRVERDTLRGRELKGMHSIIMDKAVAVITDPEWLPRPGDICTFCPLKNGCLMQQIAFDGEKNVFAEEV